MIFQDDGPTDHRSDFGQWEYPIHLFEYRLVDWKTVAPYLEVRPSGHPVDGIPKRPEHTLVGQSNRHHDGDPERYSQKGNDRPGHVTFLVSPYEGIEDDSKDVHCVMRET